MYEKGLHKDAHPQNQPEATYRDALNVSLQRCPGTLTSEEGHVPLGSLPEGFRIVGRCSFPSKETLLFLKNEAGDSKIYLLQDGTLILVLEDGASDLFLGDLIQAVGSINNKGEKVVYWVDETNPPRRMNVDILTSTLYSEESLDIGLFYTFSNVPKVSLSIEESGGILRSGIYRLAIALVDDEGAETPYLSISTGCAIFPGPYLDPTATTGAESGTPTSRAISVLLTNTVGLTGFRGVKFALIKGTTEVRLLSERSLASSYTITGAENYTPGAIEEILVPAASYEKAKAITEDAGILYLGNLSKGEDLGYQKYANNILAELVEEDFQVATTLESLGGNMKIMGPADSDYRNSTQFRGYKSYRRGETYAFYISLILKDGSETPAYHIPGRSGVGNEDKAPGSGGPAFTNPAEASSIGAEKRFQIEAVPGANGLAYWENDAENYPTTDDFEVWDVDSTGQGFHTGDSLKGQPVRHHQFPENYHKNFYVSFTGKALGVKFTNIKFPQEIKEKIIGYRIYRAHRGFETMRMLDQTVMCRVAYNDDFDNKHRAWPAPLESAEDDFDPDMRVAYPFHFLRTQKSTDAISYVKKVATMTTHSDNDDYFNALQCSNQAPASLGFYRKVDEAAYLPHNTDDIAFGGEVFANLYAPTVLALKIDNPWAYNHDLVDLCRFIKDQYSPFFSQSLVWTGFQSTDLDDAYTGIETGDVYGGDTYITYHAVTGIRPDDFAGGRGHIHIHQAVVESVDLISLRHEGPEVWEVYFPKTKPTPGMRKLDPEDVELELNTKRWTENHLYYNDEYSSPENLKVAFPFNPFSELETEFPTRIARSSGEGQRRFLAADYKDLTRKRGEIVKLTSFQSNLLIHMKRGLFRTRGSEELVTGDIRAYIGSGDIFEMDPEEIFSTDEGYAGLMDPRMAALTPAGYIFADVDARRIFQLSDGLVDISSFGLKGFFKENLNIENGGKILVGYDPSYDRVFISKDDGDDYWTLSYLPTDKVWESFHSGNPDYYLWTPNKLLASQGGTLYEIGGGAEGSYFGAQASFEVETVENREPHTQKVVQALMIDCLFEEEGVEDTRECFDTYRVYSDHQDTGEKTITYFTLPGGNARRTQRIWSVNGLRHETPAPTLNGTLPATLKRRMIGKHHAVRLKYENNDGKKITLFGLQLATRPSIR